MHPVIAVALLSQGSHRLKKYLNLNGFLEKSLKIKYAMKSTGKSFKGLEKSLNSSILVGLNTVDRDLNQDKIAVPLFGAAYAAPNIGTTILWERSGRVLDSRLRGRGFEPHRRHCVVSLSKNIDPSLVLVQPRKTRPFITERLLMGCKESNQTKQTTILY